MLNRSLTHAEDVVTRAANVLEFRYAETARLHHLYGRKAPHIVRVALRAERAAERRLKVAARAFATLTLRQTLAHCAAMRADRRTS